MTHMILKQEISKIDQSLLLLANPFFQSPDSFANEYFSGPADEQFHRIYSFFNTCLLHSYYRELLSNRNYETGFKSWVCANLYIEYLNITPRPVSLVGFCPDKTFSLHRTSYECLCKLLKVFFDENSGFENRRSMVVNIDKAFGSFTSLWSSLVQTDLLTMQTHVIFSDPFVQFDRDFFYENLNLFNAKNITYKTMHKLAVVFEADLVR